MVRFLIKPEIKHYSFLFYNCNLAVLNKMTEFKSKLSGVHTLGNFCHIAHVVDKMNSLISLLVTMLPKKNSLF